MDAKGGGLMVALNDPNQFPIPPEVLQRATELLQAAMDTRNPEGYFAAAFHVAQFSCPDKYRRPMADASAKLFPILSALLARGQDPKPFMVEVLAAAPDPILRGVFFCLVGLTRYLADAPAAPPPAAEARP